MADRAIWSCLVLVALSSFSGCSERSAESSGTAGSAGASSPGSVSSAAGGAATGDSNGVAVGGGADTSPTAEVATTAATSTQDSSAAQGSAGGSGGATSSTASGPDTSGATSAGGQTSSCSNGVLDGDESCDDGNLDEGDGCSPDCQVVCGDYHEAAVPGPAGSCYYWEGPHVLSFSEAMSACQSLGGHLVTVTSAEEQVFLESISEFTWLGAYDGLGSKDPGQAAFMWVTGEAFEYSHWGEAQPNNTLHVCPESVGEGGCYEHCLLKEDTHTWNDTDCAWENSYTCEWDPPGT